MNPDVGILNLEMGNLRSVSNAIDSMGFDCRMVSAVDELDTLTHLVIPGVGAYAAAMRRIDERNLLPAIHAFAASGRPILGLCLGMQLLTSQGDEGGMITSGLGFIPGRTTRLDATRVPSIPHVGWNSVEWNIAHPVAAKVKTGVDFYFVHSYRCITEDPAHVIGSTDCGEVFPAVIGRDNVVGFQFHPEKSQANGLKLLEGFCDWDGKC